MAKIVFIRHGETEWNAESRLQGQLDVGLSELGLEQAAILKEGMKNRSFHRIYSSPLKRALDTARIVHAEESEILLDQRLSEIYLGKWQGLTVDEVKQSYGEEYAVFRNTPELFKSDGMETLESLGERFAQFVRSIMGEKDKQFCVVSHGTAMRAGLAKVIFGDVRFMNHLVFENGSITELDFHEYNGEITPVIYKLNETGHFRSLNKERTSTSILMGVI